MRALTSATFTVANATFVKIPYNTIVIDTDGAHNTATSTFTAPVGGLYLISASIILPAGAPAEIDLFVNAVRSHGFGYSASSNLVTGTTIFNLRKNDSIDVRVYQGSGASMVASVNAAWSYFTATLIGA